jgi:hypothetical protein
MNFQNSFSKVGFKKITFDVKLFSIEWEPNTSEVNAAWEMYVELISRISTQPLKLQDGEDSSALESLHSLFGITRFILKKYGPTTYEFSKLAILILNDVIRPFTSKLSMVKLEIPFGQNWKKFESN